MKDDGRVTLKTPLDNHLIRLQRVQIVMKR